MNIECQIYPQDHDLGKHVDTAIGEVNALKKLMDDDNKDYHGAILSQMMWDQAIAGQLLLLILRSYKMLSLKTI
jgi:hypothetical protein